MIDIILPRLTYLCSGALVVCYLVDKLKLNSKDKTELLKARDSFIVFKDRIRTK